MPDYSNPNTPLTASKYSWSITVTSGPVSYGPNAAKDCSGNYTTQPGATVGSLLAGLKNWYASEYRVPASDVAIIRYSLREK
ncbi:hypothetical protein [Streptomyces sp. AA1529]|uniref:hypothetical protein n=1 Tax=Streptomyces sp. AA1529 TaxID=1203257 RepID=UPI0002EA94C6|nr:hypothetical protein [Streptomyces sp. AA1529]